MHSLQACLFKYSAAKGEVGGHALNSHGNYIVDHEKSWNCVFEFLWEPRISFLGKFKDLPCCEKTHLLNLRPGPEVIKLHSWLISCSIEHCLYHAH